MFKKRNMLFNEIPKEGDPTLVPQVVPTTVSEADLLRVKQEADAAKARVEALEAELEKQKVNTFKEKEDWKSIAALNEERATNAENKLKAITNGLVQKEKFNALLVEAQKQGMNPASYSDLELLDFPELVVETTSGGKILVSNAQAAIAKLKTMRPHWFTANVPPINPTVPTTVTPLAPSGLVTMKDIEDAEKAYRLSGKQDDAEKLKQLIYKFKTQGR